MENYTAGAVKEFPHKFPFDDAIPNMRVKPGTRLQFINRFAAQHMKAQEHRQIAFSGLGQACSKVVSCVEVFKRDHRKEWPLYQQTKIYFVRVEEFWEPTVEGLERLKVNRDIPAIAILLSKDALDDSMVGCQTPGEFTCEPKSPKPPNKNNKYGTDRSNRWKKQKRSAHSYQPSSVEQNAS